MKTRIITGVALALFLLVPAVLFTDTLFLPILASLLAVVGVFEVLRCIGQEKNYLLTLPAYLLSAAAPFVCRYADVDRLLMPALALVLLLAMFYTLTLNVFFPDRTDCRTNSLGLLMTEYVAAGFSAICIIARFETSHFVLPIVFLAAFATDVFALFSGMLFGRHKLCPKISPKKTVEGAIGGTVACVLVLLLYGLIIDKCTDYATSYRSLSIGGAVFAIVSQLGDLVASSVKRTFGIKDYGKLFPGHGGVMDRFDSVIPVALAVAIMLIHFDIQFFYR